MNMNGYPILASKDQRPLSKVEYTELRTSLSSQGPSSPESLLEHFREDGSVATKIRNSLTNFSEEHIPALESEALRARAFASSIDFNSAPGEPRDAVRILGELSTSLLKFAELPGYRRETAILNRMAKATGLIAPEEIAADSYRKNVGELFDDPTAGNLQTAYHLAETQRTVIGDTQSHKIANLAFQNSLYRPSSGIHTPSRRPLVSIAS